MAFTEDFLILKIIFPVLVFSLGVCRAFGFKDFQDLGAHKNASGDMNHWNLKQFDGSSNFGGFGKISKEQFRGGCGSIFKPKEFRTHFQTCALAQQTSTVVDSSEEDDRKKRDLSKSFSVKFDDDADNKIYVDNFEISSQNHITRRRRQAAISFSGQPSRQQWNKAEHPRLMQNPYLASCMFRQTGMVNATGYPIFETITERVKEALRAGNNNTSENFTAIAFSIANTCVIQLQNVLTDSAKPKLPSDNPVALQYGSVMQLGKCLMRSIQIKCHSSSEHVVGTDEINLSTGGNQHGQGSPRNTD